jgi:multiple sugar transport system ATP-binding protein
VLGIPALREDVAPRKLLYGVRPEHVSFDDASALRADVLGSEYLGTSQIVTCATSQGTRLRAKMPVDVRAMRGDRVGLRFDARTVSVFDAASGRALKTARDDTVAAHG